jgi:hypothetical protein
MVRTEFEEKRKKGKRVGSGVLSWEWRGYIFILTIVNG